MSAEQKADISIGVIEALISINDDLGDLKESINNPLQKELLTNLVDKLNIIIDILDETPQPIIVSNNNKSKHFRSVVYSLGIQSEVLRLRDLGKSIKTISEVMNVNSSVIGRFFRYYDHISNAEKIRVRSNSVMNTPERLEELFNMILRRLHMLEGQNDELHVQYIKEMRQTLALANQVGEKMVNYREYQKFTQNVWELLKSELPEKRSMIVQKIAYLQQNNHEGLDNVLAPSTI